ncbi:MAG: IS66 family transposase [Pirellulaceae bacterium]
MKKCRPHFAEHTVLNIDETGHPENGQTLWTWAFHSPGPDGFTLFHIDSARSSDVLKDFLRETSAGVVGCDYRSARCKFLADIGASMLFCWAHLISDVIFHNRSRVGTFDLRKNDLDRSVRFMPQQWAWKWTSWKN